MRVTRVLAALLVFAGAASAQDTAMPSARFAGAWTDTLIVGDVRIPLVVHLTAEGAGYAAALDSPDQLAFGIPGTAVVVGDSVSVSVPSIGGTLAGVLTDAGQIVGTWSQGGAALPLALRRIGGATVRRRPQEPRPPFPYTEEEVVVPSAASGVTLAGTVTRPPGTGPFPAVVLVSGSGQQDRDESVMGHRPFAVLADVLARAGVLVLRTDDRGVGGSSAGPDLMSATTADFADDARGAVAYLASRPDVSAVGIVGHSEGGVIAPIVAGQTGAVAFVVLLAGTSVRGDAVIAHQGARIQQAAGLSAEGARAVEAVSLYVIGRVRESAADGPLPEALRTAVVDTLRATVLALSPADAAALGATDDVALNQALEQSLDQTIAMVAMPWMRYFLAYDPAPALRALRVPVLALFGARDLQVSPDQNEAPMRAALAASASPAWSVETLPGLNHLFQTAPTGQIAEYAEIEETMSPVVLNRVAAWILDVAAR